MKQQEPKTRVAVAIGSNIGDRLMYFTRAQASLKRLGEEFQCSSIYETKPVDSSSEDLFLNAVVSFSCPLSASRLLVEMQNIEKENKRQRTISNGDRTLDLDLLLYGRECIQSPFLTIPHPRMTERMFVMLPLLEVWPSESLFPGTQNTLRSFLKKAQQKDLQSQPVALKYPAWGLP